MQVERIVTAVLKRLGREDAIPPTVDVEPRVALKREEELLEAARAQDSARLRAATSDASDRLEAARSAFRMSEAAHAAARFAEQQAAVTHAARITAVRARLRETSSAAIVRFRREMLDLREQAASRASEPTEGRKRHWLTQKFQVVWFRTEHPSILSRIAAIDAVRAEADGLRLEALTDGELAVRLTAMRERLPPIRAQVIEP